MNRTTGNRGTDDYEGCARYNGPANKRHSPLRPPPSPPYPQPMSFPPAPPASRAAKDAVTLTAQADLIDSLRARLDHALQRIGALEMMMGVDKRTLIEEIERLRLTLRQTRHDFGLAPPPRSEAAESAGYGPGRG
jgi:hypothetical protein